MPFNFSRFPNSRKIKRYSPSGGGGGGGGGSTGPGVNEPAGYTQVNELDMTAFPTIGTANSVGLTYSGYFTDVTHITDNTAPVTSNVWDMRWPANDALGGASPGHKFQLGRPSDAFLPAHSVGIYSRMRFQVSSNFTHNTNSGTKFWFLKNGGSMNHFCGLVDPNNTGGTGKCGYFWGNQGGATFASFYSTNLVPRDTWFEWEILVEYGTAGSSNGRVRQWQNGSTLVNDTGACMILDTGWAVPNLIWLDDVYGFGSAATPNFDMHWYMNRWYVSVK